MSVEQYSLVANDWLNLEFIINDLTQRVVGQEVHSTSSPTFATGTITNNLAVGGDLAVTGDFDIDGTLTLSGLTASRIVATDASKALVSLASPLIVAEGGTGAVTFTDGGILLGSGTSPITAMSVLADGEFVVGDGTTDPVAESGNTARTSLGLGTGDSPTFVGLTLSGKTTMGTAPGASGIAIDGTDPDYILQTHGKVTTDLVTGAYSSVYNSMNITANQTNNTSIFTNWAELYITGDLTLSSANNAAIWGNLEMADAGGSLTLSADTLWLAGVVGTIISPDGLVIGTSRDVAGVLSDSSITAGYTNNGTFSAFAARKSYGKEPWPVAFNVLPGSATIDFQGQGCTLGPTSIVFQPITDSTTFFQVMDADGGTPILNVDSTNERVGISIANPTAKLHLPAGTATAGTTPLKFTSGTHTITPEAGAIEFDGHGFHATEIIDRRVISMASDSIISATSVSNTTDETTLYMATISAAELHANKIFIVRCFGKLSVDDGANDVTLRIKIGTVTVGTLVSTPKIVTDEPWHAKSFITIRTIGAGGTVSSHSDMLIEDTHLHEHISSQAIDTTAANNITVTAQWTTADANDIITVDQGFLEVLQ